MKKLLLASLAIVMLCAIAFVAQNIIADEGAAATGPDEKVLPASKGDVTFPHKKHAGPADADGFAITCETCHHTLKDGSKAQSCSSEGCHSETSEINVRNAFHQLCYKGCHKTKNADEGKAAPTKCSECHKKE
jgi:hypothetical protein